MVSETWNRNELNRLFREKQVTVLEHIRKDNDTRAPLVVMAVAGWGTGKLIFSKPPLGLSAKRAYSSATTKVKIWQLTCQKHARLYCCASSFKRTEPDHVEPQAFSLRAKEGI